jgi:hypothetical protein
MSTISVRRVCALVGMLSLLSACGVADAGRGLTDAGRGVVLPRLGVATPPTPAASLAPAQASQVTLRTWSGVVDAYVALDDGQLASAATGPELGNDRAGIALSKLGGESPGTWIPTATVEEAQAVGADSIVARVTTRWSPGSRPDGKLLLLRRSGPSAPWKVALSTNPSGNPAQLGAAIHPQGPLDEAAARQLAVPPGQLEKTYADYLTGAQDSPFASGYWTSEARDGFATNRTAFSRSGASLDYSGQPAGAVDAYRLANGGAVVFFEWAVRKRASTRGAVCLNQDQARSTYGLFVAPGSYDEIAWELRGMMAALVPPKTSGAQATIVGGTYQATGASTRPATNPRCL